MLRGDYRRNDELQQLQRAVDRITAEKRQVEAQAAEQAETCRQLSEANNTLSARTLTLAEEAASAPEMVRKQLDAQLSECKASLRRAQDELDTMRQAEGSQRVALLDELNTMQTENANLRAQLRAVKK
jgi:chromosome segregation ATPase